MNILKNTVDNVIKNILSKYFKLDKKDKERISNRVIFNNMEIDVDEINKLLYNLPIMLQEGTLDKLSIDYSIQIWKEAVKISLKGLTLKLVINEEFIDIELLKKKEIQNNFESFKSLIMELIDTKEYSKGFIEGLVTKIIDNLQIDIDDVKIILFCPTINKKPVFEIGLKNFNFKTKDENDMDVFFDRENDIYKGVPILKKIELFKIYFRICSGFKYGQNAIQKDQKILSRDDNSYDLLRLNQIVIRIKIKTDETKLDSPQFTVNIDLTRIELNLKQKYIIYFIEMSKKFSEFQKKYENEKYQNLERPECSILEGKPKRRTKRRTVMGDRDPEETNWNACKWWVYAILTVIKQNFIKRRDSVFQKIFDEFNIGLKKTLHLNTTIMKIFAGVINESLEEMYQNDFSDVSLLEKKCRAIDMKMLLFLLPFSEIKKIIKLYCVEKLNELKKRKEQKSKFNNFLYFIGAKKKQESEQIQNFLENNVQKADIRKAEIKFKLCICFNTFLINLKYTQKSIFKLKFRDFDLDFLQQTDKQKFRVKFDKIISELERDKNNYQIFYSNNNKEKIVKNENKKQTEFFEMNYVSEQLENDDKTEIDIKINSTTLNIKKILFFEINLIIKELKQLSVETSFNPNLNVNSFQRNITKKLQTTKKKNVLLNLNINNSDTFIFFEENSKKPFLNINTGDINMLFDNRENLNNPNYNAQLCIHQAEISYSIKNIEPYKFISLTFLANLHKEKQNDKHLKKNALKDNKDLEIVLYSEDITLNYYPFVILEVGSNLKEFLKTTNLVENSNLPQSVSSEVYDFKMMEFESSDELEKFSNANLASEFFLNWERSVLSIYNDKRLSIACFDQSFLNPIIAHNFTYFIFEEIFYLKIRHQKGCRLFYFKFDSLESIKEFIQLILLTEPALKKSVKKTTLDRESKFFLKVFSENISFKLFNENEILNYEINMLNFFLNYSKEEIVINFEQLLTYDNSLINKAENKLILNISKRKEDDERDVSEKKKAGKTFEEIKDSFYNFKGAEKSLQSLEQSFFVSSLMNIKNKIYNFVTNPKLEDLNKDKNELSEIIAEKTNNYSFKILIGNQKVSCIQIDADKLLFIWNIEFLNNILKYIQDNKKLIFEHVLPQSENPSESPNEKKEENENKREETPLRSQIKRESTFTAFESPSTNLKRTFFVNDTLTREEEKLKKDPTIKSELKVNLKDFTILNYNKSAYQTEIILNDFNLDMKTKEEYTLIKVLNKRLQINDLTNYPFTKKEYELINLKNVTRKKIIDLDVKPPNIFILKDLLEKKHIEEYFKIYSLVCDVELKNPNIVKDDKVKTKASVYINNLQINYYQQIIFRLIDFITMSILPFVNPDIFPDKTEDILKRMTDFFITTYEVNLYDTKIYLRPNYLCKKYLKVSVPQVIVNNKVEKEFNRDLLKEADNTQKTNYVSESISNISSQPNNKFSKSTFKNDSTRHQGKNNFNNLNEKQESTHKVMSNKKKIIFNQDDYPITEDKRVDSNNQENQVDDNYFGQNDVKNYYNQNSFIPNSHDFTSSNKEKNYNYSNSSSSSNNPVTQKEMIAENFAVLKDYSCGQKSQIGKMQIPQVNTAFDDDDEKYKLKFSQQSSDKMPSESPGYFTENITIVLDTPKISGYYKTKIMLDSNEIKISFNRFLFFKEIEALKGTDFILKNIFFGNRIKIESEKVNVSLFKDDFIYFMTCLFNNINNDDYMDFVYMNDYKILDYANPMDLKVVFKKLCIEFRYDEEKDEEKKIFADFELPKFVVSMTKDIKNIKVININSISLKSFCYEINEEYKDHKKLPFIRPLEKSQTGTMGRLNRRMTKYNENKFEQFVKVDKSTLGQDLFHSEAQRARRKGISNDFDFEKEQLQDELKFVFNMKIDMDDKGNKNILLDLSCLKIFLIPALITLIQNQTAMNDEMGFNNLIQPGSIEFFSDMNFKIELNHSFIVFPNSQKKFFHNIYLYIEHLDFLYAKINHIKIDNSDKEDEIKNRLDTFLNMENKKRGAEQKSIMNKDDYLETMINSYNREKFVIIENIMDIKLKGVDLIVVQNNNLLKVQNKNLSHVKTNFHKENFQSTTKVDDTDIRYILNNMELDYNIKHLYNNVYKGFTCSEGEVKINKLDLALSIYDLVYLSNFSSYLEKFNFHKLVLRNDSQLEMARILNEKIPGYGVPLKQENRKRLTVNKFDLDLFICDDIWESGIPLIDLKAQFKPIEIINSHLFNLMTLELHLDMDYYNLENKIWEPILENIEIEFEQKHNIRNETHKKQIKLKKISPCINVSTDFLNILSALNKEKAIKNEIQENKTLINKSDFFFKNNLGYKIEIFINYSDKTLDSFIIENDTMKNIFEKNNTNTISTKNIESFKIKIFAHSRVIKLKNIFILNDLKSRYIIKEATKFFDSFEIGTSLKYENSQKIVSFFSPFLIENRTGLELKLKICNKGCNIFESFPNESQTFVPIDYTDGGSFCIRIINKNLKKAYSNNYCLLPPSQNIDSKQYININEKYYFLAYLQQDELGLNKIVIYPTIIFKNYLMNDLQLDIIINDSDKKESLFFQAKKFIRNCYINTSSDFGIYASFRRYTSHCIKIKTKELLKNKFYQKVWLLNPKNEKIMSFYIISNENLIVKTLFFYHKSLLICETFEPFRFTQNIKSNDVGIPLIAQNTTNQTEVYMLKHDKNLKIMSKDFHMSSTNIDISKMGTTSYYLTGNDQLRKELTVNIYVQKFTDELKQYQKIVKILPKYIFINKTEYRISIINLDELYKEIIIEQQERKPFFIRDSKKKNYYFKLKCEKSDWSEKIDFSKPGFYTFSVIVKLNNDKAIHFNLEINLIYNSIFVILYENKNGVFKIINDLDNVNILFYQKEELSKTFDYDYEIETNQTDSYSWRFPDFKTNFLFLQFIDSKNRVLMNQISLETILDYNKKEINLDNKRLVYIELTFKGSYGVIKLWDVEKLQKENQLFSKNTTDIIIPDLGLSVVYGKTLKRKELFYIHMTNLDINVESKKLHTFYSVNLCHLSIDWNSKIDSVFPVVFTQVDNKEMIIKNNKQFLKMILSTKNKEDVNDLTVIRNLEIEIYPSLLRIEEEFINNISTLSNEFFESESKNEAFLNKKHRKLNSQLNPTDNLIKDSWKTYKVENLRPVYIQNVKLSSIEIFISFKKNLETKSDDIAVVYAPVLNAFGVIVASFDNVPLKLPKFTIKFETNSISVLQQKIITEYKKIIFSTTLKLVGSANIIGNPVNFYTEMKSGVKDLVKDTKNMGPKGVYTGTKSIAKHTVAGTFGSVNRITRTLGDGFISITTDHEYLRKREQLFAKKQNKFLTGFQQFGFSIYDGIKGVVTKPYEGAKQNGFKGFLKGTYKGISGLIFKPVTGVLDLTSASADGVRMLVSENSIDERQRPPRPFYSEKRFYKKYNRNEANIMKVLPNKNGDFFNIVQIEKVNFDFDDLIILLEGIILYSENKIAFRKNVEFLIGCIDHDKYITIEYFDMEKNDKVTLNSIIIDVDDRDIKNRIMKNIDFVIQEYQNKVKLDINEYERDYYENDE